MNRWFNQFSWSLEKGKTTLFGKVAIGASGAATMDAVNSQGIASVTRTSAGLYTIVLQDVYVKFLTFLSCHVDATSPGVGTPYVVSQTVNVAATKSVIVQFQNTAGTPTDPASGDEWHFQIWLSKTTAN